LKTVEDVTPPGSLARRLRMPCNRRCGAAPIRMQSKVDRAVQEAALRGRDTVTVGVDL